MSGPARRELSRAELDGFHAGLAHLLARRRETGRSDPKSERALREAERLLAEGDLARAERSLLALSAELKAAEPEPIVDPRPRGLVGYRPIGPPEVPTPPEEDRLPNRLLLLQRVAGLRASQGRDVEAARARLVEAERHLREGRRAAATEALDRAAEELDRNPPIAGHGPSRAEGEP